MRVLVMAVVWAIVLSVFFESLSVVSACEERVPITHNAWHNCIGNGEPKVNWTIKPDKITIYTDGPACKVLQIIPYDVSVLSELSDSERAIAQDMNFDGYMDLKIMSSRGNVNVYYDCWLWDAKRQKFILNEELSKVVSPQFRADTKTILSFTHISAIDNLEATYIFQKGKLKLVKTIEQTYEKEKNEIIRRSYHVDEKGKWNLINEDVIPLEQK